MTEVVYQTYLTSDMTRKQSTDKWLGQVWNKFKQINSYLICSQNVQKVTTVSNVLRRVVHTVVVTDCVTRSQVNVLLDVKVVTMELCVMMVT